MVYDPYLGQIFPTALSFPVRGFALCEGQILPINQNAALFSLLGTTYGGNGMNNFALPDLRGRAAIHPGQGPGLEEYVLGQQGGSETVTLTINEMPAHGHSLNACSEPGDNASPQGTLLANTGETDFQYRPSGTAVQMGLQALSVTGAGQPVDIRQPYLVICYQIALQGIFPSRA